MAEDEEEKLPTSEGGEEDKGEEKPQTVIVDYGGGIIVHHRLPDGSLDVGYEFSDAELVPDEAIADEDSQTAPDSEPNNSVVNVMKAKGRKQRRAHLDVETIKNALRIRLCTTTPR